MEPRTNYLCPIVVINFTVKLCQSVWCNKALCLWSIHEDLYKPMSKLTPISNFWKMMLSNSSLPFYLLPSGQRPLLYFSQIKQRFWMLLRCFRVLISIALATDVSGLLGTHQSLTLFLLLLFTLCLPQIWAIFIKLATEEASFTATFKSGHTFVISFRALRSVNYTSSSFGSAFIAAIGRLITKITKFWWHTL